MSLERDMQIDITGSAIYDERRSMQPCETFTYSTKQHIVQRTIRTRDSRRTTTSLSLRDAPDNADLCEVWDQSFLRLCRRPRIHADKPPVRVVDLFSGCGLMSLGVWEACRALERRAVVVMACDVEPSARETYATNFPGSRVVPEPIEQLFDGRRGARPTSNEKAQLRALGDVDILVGGPPCQGHSNLNNHTRRDDPKNQLYGRMARFAELVRPRHIIVENVPQVLCDRGAAVDRTKDWLVWLGYLVDDGVVELGNMGVAQRRKRHVLVASLQHQPDVGQVCEQFWRRPRSVMWAIEDLLDIVPDREIDRPSSVSAANRRRIEYLFHNNRDDLPDSMRPDCHRLKLHSYRSVYGRMKWTEPAQTITSGFLSMGQGRFVHAKRRRTLTVHEAARLQSIPDFFSFPSNIGRSQLAVLIGNAVPTRLTYVFAIELLR